MLPQKLGLHKTDNYRFRLKTKICEVLSHLTDSDFVGVSKNFKLYCFLYVFPNSNLSELKKIDM